MEFLLLRHHHQSVGLGTLAIPHHRHEMEGAFLIPYNWWSSCYRADPLQELKFGSVLAAAVCVCGT